VKEEGQAIAKESEEEQVEGKKGRKLRRREWRAKCIFRFYVYQSSESVFFFEIVANSMSQTSFTASRTFY
jgi:hypothetical protein